MVYVTHDQVEAMTMADRIVVLRAGVIEQVGSPLDLYHKPNNTFVAGFIGAPKMNLIRGDQASNNRSYTIGVRPEHINISKTKGEWRGKVGVSEHLGSDTYIHVKCEGIAETLTVRANGELNCNYGDELYLTPEVGLIHRFDESGLRIT